MQPHHQFFTSLKHLEKRLKLENHPAPPPPPPSTVSAPPPPPPELTNTATQQSDPLGMPIYLNSTSPTRSNQHESEAPDEFLSASSPDFPPTLENQHSEANSNRTAAEDRAEKSGLDRDIELLMQLLSLPEVDGGERVGDVGGCDEGFYEKVVGVKGPRSGEEVERLNGWIEYFMKGGKKEPLAVAHLLLGKACSVHSTGGGGGGGGGDGFVFPSTIDEFLRNDPPVD